MGKGGIAVFVSLMLMFAGGVGLILGGVAFSGYSTKSGEVEEAEEEKKGKAAGLRFKAASLFLQFAGYGTVGGVIFCGGFLGFIAINLGDRFGTALEAVAATEDLDDEDDEEEEEDDDEE